MSKVKIFFLVLILFIFSFLFSEEKMVIRFENPSASILNEFLTPDYDVASYKPNSYLDIVITITKYNELISRGFDVQITQTEKQMKKNLKDTTELDGYRDYNETLTELIELENSHPELCKLYDIGESWGKIYSDAGNSNYDDYLHEIWALKVSDNVLEEEDEPCVYYLGEHHAREPISLEVVMAVLNHIIDNYGIDPTITDNVNNTQIWFVPLVNPDGHKVVIDEMDLWWRKNICDNNENGQLDPENYNGYPDGVDPNRNYGFEWGNVGASNDPLNQLYHGPEPFSEPEVFAMKELMESHHFVTGITYHSYGELVLFPFGYNNNVISPDYSALQDLAVAMAQPMGYNPVAAWQLYPCMGTTDDYSYGVHGTFSFTIELATEFIPPASQVQNICDENIIPALSLLDRVNHSCLTGMITNSQTSEPLVAEIYVEGVDNTGVFRYPYESDENFGRYYRLLQDGFYDVTFSAYGFESQTVEDVEIISSEQTILDIVMEPVTTTSFSGTVTDGDSGLPIQYVSVELLNTPIDPEFTDENGEFNFPSVYVGDYEVRIAAVNYISIIESITITETYNIFDFELYESDAISFETGNFDDFWIFAGDADWFIDSSTSYDGVYSAKSGSIGSWDDTSISVELDVIAAGEISFWKKVSSEEGYDFLSFSIDGLPQGQWSGEDDWSEEIFPVDIGTHIFEWKYEKDGNTIGGDDCAWIDYIIFPLNGGEPELSVDPAFFNKEICTNQIENEILTLSNIGGGIINYDIYLSEPVTWLCLDIIAGMLVAGDSEEIQVTFDTTDLEIGDYVCYIMINDDIREETIVPVMLSVVETGSGNDLLPTITELSSIYPNPFNPSTTFSFSLKADSKVTINIFNIKGQKVKTLINKNLNSGYHNIVWNGKDDNGKNAPTGVYFSLFDAHDEIGDYTITRKIILLK